MKHRIRDVNRRQFLTTAAALVAAPYIVPGSALGADGGTPASERITWPASAWATGATRTSRPSCPARTLEYVAICDVEQKAAGKRQGPRGQALWQHRLQDVLRFPRGVGPRRHRYRAAWNRKRAATQLNISYKALLYKIRQYDIRPRQAG